MKIVGLLGGLIGVLIGVILLVFCYCSLIISSRVDDNDNKK